ncbi:MAG: CotH kinase family protein [Anaerolineae bacterium]|nr:CotH kinase family protein [Anaerolineae bacterium]
MGERGHLHQAYESKKDTLYPRIILLAMLALAAIYAAEMVCQTCAQAASMTVPVFSVLGGYYDQDILVEIDGPPSSSHVIFTVDGSVPTQANGSVYVRPIRLGALAVTVVRARAVFPDGRLGPVVSASYFVGVQATLPLVSLIVDPADLWDAESGIYANPHERGETWERPVDVTYVDQDHTLGFQIPAGVRIHGHGTRGFAKMSFRLYFRQEYGINRLTYPLFPGSEVTTFKRLVLHNSGQDRPVFPHTNWTDLRNQLATGLAFQVDGLAPHSRPVLLFINGELWGIYQLRERLDRFFLADHYGVEEADFLEAPDVRGQSDVVMGDREDWDRLQQFLETHDLADPASYAYVESQVDIANFIDYNILQIYASNDDWPHQNVHQFRPSVPGGRWHWMFWDSDRGFAVEPVGRVDANIMAHLLEHNDRYTGGRDMLLLRKLLGNPEFREWFLSRTADLLNTTLAPPSVIGQIDTLAAGLEPDVVYEASRWSISSNWAANVEGLRAFARRRPDFVRQHMVEGFDLAGTAALTFEPPAGGGGYVAVNGVLLDDLPWRGIYFQGLPIQVVAVPAPGYRFAGWEGADLPQTPAIAWTVVGPRSFAPRFERVGADALQPGDVVFVDHSMGPDSHLEDDWFDLRVARPGGVDLRGWRVTDNDTKTATDEGSLILSDNPALARVPRGTVIRVIVRRASDESLLPDDLGAWDRQMVLYVDNGNLDASADPGFNLGPRDNLVLLAPGSTEAFGDDLGIAFVSNSPAVTPASFGVMAEGVVSSDQD